LVGRPIGSKSTIDRKHIVLVHLVNEYASSQFYDQSCECFKNARCVCVKICVQTKPCTKIEKEEIIGHDFVSKPRKLEFCVDLSSWQGVCLSFAPSFLVTEQVRIW
jgi:hypothetical protein